jgi:putative ABC transport system permease protein
LICNKKGVPTLFGEIPLFSLSYSGIAAGTLVGFLTVWLASLAPARKAAKVAPLQAVAGNGYRITSKQKKRGLLTRKFRVEYALGMNNALRKKKTLVLMSCSIAFSIIMFLGFHVFVDFMYTALKTTKPYTLDLSITSKQGILEEFSARLARLDGVKKVYGRAGCILGIIIQRELITHFLTSMHIIWKFPWTQLILAVVFTMFITVISMPGPVKRIQEKPVSEVVNAL